MRTSATLLLSLTNFNNKSPQFSALLTRNIGCGREGYVAAEPTLSRLHS